MTNEERVERRPWPRNPRYTVGEDGSILRPDGELLGQFVDPNGYLRVNVHDAMLGRRVQRYVHVLVAEAFHGLRPEGMEAAHGDGDILNVHPSNLRWATPKGNADDRAAHGRTVMGVRHPKAKLNPDAVRAIRLAHAGGQGISALAREYAVANGTIRQIVERISWKHVE